MPDILAFTIFLLIFTVGEWVAVKKGKRRRCSFCCRSSAAWILAGLTPDHL